MKLKSIHRGPAMTMSLKLLTFLIVVVNSHAALAEDGRIGEEEDGNPRVGRTVPQFFDEAGLGFDRLLQQSEEAIMGPVLAGITEAIDTGDAAKVSLSQVTSVLKGDKVDANLVKQTNEKVARIDQYALRAAQVSKRWIDKDFIYTKTHTVIANYDFAKEPEEELIAQLDQFKNEIAIRFVSGVAADNDEPALNLAQVTDVSDLYKSIDDCRQHLTEILKTRTDRNALLDTEGKLKDHRSALESGLQAGIVASSNLRFAATEYNNDSARLFSKWIPRIAANIPVTFVPTLVLCFPHWLHPAELMPTPQTKTVSEDTTGDGRADRLTVVDVYVPTTVVEFRFAMLATESEKFYKGLAGKVDELNGSVDAYAKKSIANHQESVIAKQKQLAEWLTEFGDKTTIETRAVGKWAIADPEDKRSISQIEGSVTSLEEQIATLISQLAEKIKNEFKAKR